MNECFITKARLWSLLGEDSFQFATWLLSENASAKAFKIIFDSIADDFNLNDPLVQNVLFPLLVSEGVISQQTEQRVNEYISLNIPQTYNPNV